MRIEGISRQAAGETAETLAALMKLAVVRNPELVRGTPRNRWLQLEDLLDALRDAERGSRIPSSESIHG